MSLREQVEDRIKELEPVREEYDALLAILSLLDDGSIEEENGRLFLPAGNHPWDPTELLKNPDDLS